VRVLWVKVGGLWPLTSGGRIRSFQMIRELSKRHSVSVLTTYADGAEALNLRAMLPDCERLTSFPHSPAKRTSSRFVTGLARSWLSSLPVDMWRWRVPELREAAGGGGGCGGGGGGGGGGVF
jgi:hypothetical protein